MNKRKPRMNPKAFGNWRRSNSRLVSEAELDHDIANEIRARRAQLENRNAVQETDSRTAENQTSTIQIGFEKSQESNTHKSATANEQQLNTNPRGHCLCDSSVGAVKP